MWPAFPTSDYYGSSATPRRPQRTVRLPRTRRGGSGGHRRDASHVHHRPLGRVGAQLYPGGIAARLPQHSTRPRPPEQKPVGRDDPKRQPGSSTPTAHSRQFRGCCPVSGLQALIRLLRLSALLPHPARWRRTVARSSVAAPALRRTPGIRLPLRFSRPLRRPKVGPFTPTRLDGALWRSPGLDDMEASAATRSARASLSLRRAKMA